MQMLAVSKVTANMKADRSLVLIPNMIAMPKPTNSTRKRTSNNNTLVVASTIGKIVLLWCAVVGSMLCTPIRTSNIPDVILNAQAMYGDNCFNVLPPVITVSFRSHVNVT